MNLSAFLADWLAANTSGRVYAVCGGTAMFLNDAICHHPKLKVIAMHHEQAAAFAAEGDFRATGQISTVMVTAGPGGTNALTGVASAYVDSIPMIVISGQVETKTLRQHPQRQRGINEIDIIDMARPVTKFAITLRKAQWFEHTLSIAFEEAMGGRPGPVWIDIPIDVQATEFKPDPNYKNPTVPAPLAPIEDALLAFEAEVMEAARPLLWIGNGIRLAHGEIMLRELADRWICPIISSWTGSDLLPTAHPNYIGRAGIYGDRASNWAVQTADLIIAVGTRLSIPQTGHNLQAFAPQATKIVVDVDIRDIEHKGFSVDWAIGSDARLFLKEAVARHTVEWDRPAWLNRCRSWSDRYPVVSVKQLFEFNNSYAYIHEIERYLRDDDIIVCDVGAGAYSVMQSLRLKGRQRLFHSGGLGCMGSALPLAIGAAVGTGKRVICIAGDGGMMMNLQELQTIVQHNLPIAIFVFCNGGYMTMQTMQQQHFGREAISSYRSGLSVPSFRDLATAFCIRAADLPVPNGITDLRKLMDGLPLMAQFHMDPKQELAPKLMSRVEKGRLIPATLDRMYPWLDDELLREELAV